MTGRPWLFLIVLAACAETSPPEQPPTPVGEPQVEYPPALFEQGVGGTVQLLLFVDSAGAVVAESTRVETSSGYPALDSSALVAAPRLRYAPGLRNGKPAAMPFVQPIHFRHPGSRDSSP